MISYEVAMNILDVMDGGQPLTETIQLCKSVGAKMLHDYFVDVMRGKKWQAIGSETNKQNHTTPHIRRWDFLVLGQRQPLYDLEDMEIEEGVDYND